MESETKRNRKRLTMVIVRASSFKLYFFVICLFFWIMCIHYIAVSLNRRWIDKTHGIYSMFTFLYLELYRCSHSGSRVTTTRVPCFNRSSGALSTKKKLKVGFKPERHKIQVTTTLVIRSACMKYFCFSDSNFQNRGPFMFTRAL